MTSATLDDAPQDGGKDAATDRVRPVSKTRVQLDLMPRAAALIRDKDGKVSEFRMFL